MVWKKCYVNFDVCWSSLNRITAILMGIKGKCLVSYCVVSQRKDWLEFDLFQWILQTVCVCVLTLTINIIRTRDGIFPIVTIDPLCGRGNIGTQWSIDFRQQEYSPVHGDKGGLNLPDACSNMCTGHSLRW